MNTVKDSESLANAKDYFYEVYTVDSVEEIMICAQEEGERERESCAYDEKERTQIEGKKKIGGIYCVGAAANIA